MYDKMYALTKNGYTFIKHAGNRQRKLSGQKGGKL